MPTGLAQADEARSEYRYPTWLNSSASEKSVTTTNPNLTSPLERRGGRIASPQDRRSYH